jgi:hypothetical protein
MPDKNPEPEFDLEAVYDAEIAPLMTQIIDVCKRHGMPMVASFCYAVSEEDGFDFCTSSVPRDNWAPPAFDEARRAFMSPRSGLLGFTITKKD